MTMRKEEGKRKRGQERRDGRNNRMILFICKREEL